MGIVGFGCNRNELHTCRLRERVRERVQETKRTSDRDIVGAGSTVAERWPTMRVDAGSNPCQTEVASAVVRS